MGTVLARAQESGEKIPVPVSLAKAMERETALRAALGLLEPPSINGKDVCIKGNYNSADDFPASTHPETLRLVVQMLRHWNCGRISLAERSGMGSTRAVWERMGGPALARELDLTLIALDELGPEKWRSEKLPGSHWRRGIEVPEFLNRETCVVEICNLKTHRFGGQFSASLKNSIGLIAKRSHEGSPYNFMEELHASPNQRLMIAEVNQVYRPALVVIDAMQVFIDGGPESGGLASPQVILASYDRIAADAAGVALLRHHGAGPALGQQKVFDYEQIKRAAELNLGAKSGSDIKFLSEGTDSRNLSALLQAILAESPAEEKE